MQPTKTSAKDFFLHLGAMIALYATAINLVNLLFTVINKAYPKVLSYDYSTYSISFPVSVMIIMFPIFILLMWLLEKSYVVEPEKKHIGVRRWLIYITLFVSGLVTAGVLITVLYYFIDGQELTTSFLLKILVTCMVSLAVFMYYITDIMEKLTSTSRLVWTIASTLVIVGVIVAGFSVIGSPRTQQLMRYDEEKVSDLQNLDGSIKTYYQTKKVLPEQISDLITFDVYTANQTDPQTQKPYDYKKTSSTEYQICADFNKPSDLTRTVPIYGSSWTHPAGYHCFQMTIYPDEYQASVKAKTVPASPVY